VRGIECWPGATRVSHQRRAPAKGPLHPNTPPLRLLVPTVDTARGKFVVGGLVRAGHHTLVMGPVGAGKTLMLASLLEGLPADKAYVTINFSAQTSSAGLQVEGWARQQQGRLSQHSQLCLGDAGNLVPSMCVRCDHITIPVHIFLPQDTIEGRMEKRTKGVFAPAGGKRLVAFIDDLNMPSKSKFGFMPPLELIKLWADNGFWWVLDSIELLWSAAWVQGP
jgi:dynein heavy chain